MSNVRLHDDGTLVVRSDDPGYQQVIGLAGRAREIVGVHVHVITTTFQPRRRPPPLNASHLLAELVGLLIQLSVVLPDDKKAWGREQLLRLAVERLWIVAGTTAEEYRKHAGIDPQVGPGTEIYDFRNMLAHMTSGQIHHDRVWHKSVSDLPRIELVTSRSRRIPLCQRVSTPASQSRKGIPAR